MDRVMAPQCVESLAADVATYLVQGIECPPNLVAEVEELDGLSKSRIDFFFRGATWQRYTAPALMPDETDAVEDEYEAPKIAPDCWDRAARAELALRRNTVIFAVVVAILLALLGWSVAVGTARTVNNARLQQVLD